MIIARICDPSGKTLVQTGSIKIASYEDPNDGWFPVESFNFGFKAPGSSGSTGGKGPANAAPAKANVSAAAPAAGSPDKSSEKAELSITKLIDGVSCSLMMLVMTERSTKKGGTEDKLWVDIHTISSVSFDGERCIFTNTMVHLEAVNIQSWNLSASGDSRPSESVTLRFDRSAMIYWMTSDGRVFRKIGGKGWDQTKNDSWTWDAASQKKHFPPGCS